MLALLLIGCTSWVDQTPACDLDVYGWSDDLLGHVLTGDGSGAFDYDPEDIPRQRVSGAYKPGSGNFSYTVGYSGEYWLQQEEVEGFGTVFHNGNLDLRYEVQRTDRLDEEWTTTYDVERTGCDVVVQTWAGAMDEEDPVVFIEEGRYEDALSYHWEAETDDADYAGGARINQSRTASAEAKDGSYTSFTSYSPDGTAAQDWEGDCYTDSGDYFCAGVTDTKFNGDVVQEYTVELDGDIVAEMVWEYFYEGGGTGDVTWIDGKNEVQCDYEIDEDDNCTLDCDDGTDGPC